jgi:glycosyltransferase involved in cell wall biosynthesis
MHIWTVLWARIYKIPYVISPQGTLTIFQNDHRKFRKIIFNKLFNKFIYQRASKFIVSSNQEMKSCLNIGIPYENIEIIPNGIDTKAISKLNKFKFSKPILKINKKFHILLFMARIHPKKGLNLLIKSIKILKKKNLGIFLIIAGPIVDIQYWNSIIKEVKISNLQNSIKYIGQILDEKKHEVLSLCDIYILPSYQEGLPISALEAGFFGLPLLLSKNCGINDIEKEKAGMYIDLNPNDIADKIYSMVNQKKFKKTFGYNAKKLIKNNYTIDKTILKISKIYQDIIN